MAPLRGGRYLVLVKSAGDGGPAVASGVLGDDPVANVLIHHPRPPGWSAAGPTDNLALRHARRARPLINSLAFVLCGGRQDVGGGQAGRIHQVQPGLHVDAVAEVHPDAVAG